MSIELLAAPLALKPALFLLLRRGAQAEPVSVYTVSNSALIPVEAVDAPSEEAYDPYDNRKVDHPTT